MQNVEGTSTESRRVRATELGGAIEGTSPRHIGEKEQRRYEHIEEEAEQEGRYRGREKEVAARTVLKQRKEKGHRKGR